MKKISIFFTMLVTSMSAIAATTPTSYEDNTSIITPQIATSMYRTNRFTYDKDMNILICPHGMKYDYYVTTNIETCKNSNNENKWIKMENYVPAGKKFVGFKSTSQGGSHMIEIYWK